MPATMQYNVDAIGNMLGRIARVARFMPPAYMGAGIVHPVVIENQRIGWMLPGRGMVVDIPLRKLGLTRCPQFVHQRDFLARFTEWFGNERGAVLSYQALVAGRTVTKNDASYSSGSPGSGDSTWWNSFYLGGAVFPNAGSTNALSNQSNGAMRITDPPSGKSKYLIGWSMNVTSNACNIVMLVDLLVAIGKVSTNVTTAQTVNSAALTRYTSGAGVLLTFVVTGDGTLGATPSTITVNYTNQNGTGGQTAIQNMKISESFQGLEPSVGPFFPLAAGDYGIQSAQTVTLSAAMGGAGTLGGLLYYPLSVMPVGDGGMSYERGLANQIDGLTLLPTGTDGHVGFLSVIVYGQGPLIGAVRTVSA